MVFLQNEKQFWELCFFEKRAPMQNQISDYCLYYLVIIEVTTTKIPQKGKGKGKTKAQVVKEAQELVKWAVEQVKEEDNIDEEGILFPVKNVLIVDKLREEKQALKRENLAKDQQLTEKDREIRKLKEELQAYKKSKQD